MSTQTELTRLTIQVSMQQKSLLEFVSGPEAADISRYLWQVHDIAVYHSNIPLEVEEKMALLAIKHLAVKVERCA